jgi:hypothetical protein
VAASRPRTTLKTSATAAGSSTRYGKVFSVDTRSAVTPAASSRINAIRYQIRSAKKLKVVVENMSAMTMGTPTLRGNSSTVMSATKNAAAISAFCHHSNELNQSARLIRVGGRYSRGEQPSPSQPTPDRYKV